MANEPDANTDDAADLGFSFQATKSGLVFIHRQGFKVTELRGKDAATFLVKVERVAFAQQQQLMARMTGNYKRGNERLAGAHARNK